MEDYSDFMESSNQYSDAAQMIEKFMNQTDSMEWARKMLVNISRAGFFSSDRTIEEYNKDIWKL